MYVGDVVNEVTTKIVFIVKQSLHVYLDGNNISMNILENPLESLFDNTDSVLKYPIVIYWMFSWFHCITRLRDRKYIYHMCDKNHKMSLASNRVC
jgi:hypothetical protein